MLVFEHVAKACRRNILVRDILRNEMVSVLGTSYVFIGTLLNIMLILFSPLHNDNSQAGNMIAYCSSSVSYSSVEVGKHRVQISDSLHKIKLHFKFDIYSQIGGAE